MTTYYVGPGGNDSNNGTTWALRKLTLNGAEDIPVAAGDTVYVGAGTYRETLTVDVSGTAEGGAITYIGDYDGTHTDGTGGVVRITGSDNDLTQARTECITASSKNYRTFIGFALDGATYTINVTTGTNWTIDKCIHTRNGTRGIVVSGASPNLTITNNFFQCGSYYDIFVSHTSFVSNSNCVISNCIFTNNAGSNAKGILFGKYGGVTIKNCVILGRNIGIQLTAVPDAGQVVTVNNCIIASCTTGLYSPSAGFLIENYNNIVGCEIARTNVEVGANSNTFILLFDTRWFFELVGGGSMLSPFDLASYSQLINVAGTSPTTADMRGTTVQGTQREWGALEYDSSLDIKAGSGGGFPILNGSIVR